MAGEAGFSEELPKPGVMQPERNVGCEREGSRVGTACAETSHRELKFLPWI